MRVDEGCFDCGFLIADWRFLIAYCSLRVLDGSYVRAHQHPQSAIANWHSPIGTIVFRWRGLLSAFHE